MISSAITEAAFVAGVHLQAASDGDQGLTLAELVANIPHDPSAMVVYAMLFGSVLFIWRAGRSGGRLPR
ncbi:MAG: hypothetical protein ACODAB_00985 [Gemmatimonadota bacterium]